MSLAEAFQAPPQVIKCTICRILAAADDIGRERLDAALRSDNKTWPHNIVAARLIDEGHDVSESTVRRHRSRCP